MPTYEYRCGACGHEFEIEQRITADRLTDCPACKQPKLERLISASSFTLKGGGWYRDGYGNPKAPRTEAQMNDRLTKALDDDKKKETEKATETGASQSTEAAAPSSPAAASPAATSSTTTSSTTTSSS
ncbi:MAG TPA: zinc ribbon domain-containing protein [Pseudomonadota bacterium]|nr:zinc ribbon domain-containing protein [Pseudomonadota bacterium]